MVVMIIAGVLALLTVFIVPVDKSYIGYFDFKTLACLFSVLAVVCAKKAKGKSEGEKNRALVRAALVMDGIEIVRVVLNCTVGGDPMAWQRALPLYLCSIQFITLPLAAFSHGRFKEASMDFVCMFGVLGAVMGTYFAGNNYSCYPVLSFDNVFSGITHSVGGILII